MSLPKTVLDCPHCNVSGDHRIHSYGDGTAVVWCGSCHNPREMLMAQLRRPGPGPRGRGAPSTAE